MEIKEVSEEEKQVTISVMREVFDDVRSFLESLQNDFQSVDLKTQAVAVWIATQFCEGYSGFVENIRKLDRKKEDLHEIKNAMQDAQIL